MHAFRGLRIAVSNLPRASPARDIWIIRLRHLHEDIRLKKQDLLFLSKEKEEELSDTIATMRERIISHLTQIREKADQGSFASASKEYRHVRKLYMLLPPHDGKEQLQDQIIQTYHTLKEKQRAASERHARQTAEPAGAIS
ncbi:MAG: hypothetical protein HC945_01005 [Nitrosarchaeum sp.]|nr:hypothetical protein [Nitrosarchaeum sp.]